jgi:hypothetical protein
MYLRVVLQIGRTSFGPKTETRANHESFAGYFGLVGACSNDSVNKRESCKTVMVAHLGVSVGKELQYSALISPGSQFAKKGRNL